MFADLCNHGRAPPRFQTHSHTRFPIGFISSWNKHQTTPPSEVPETTATGAASPTSDVNAVEADVSPAMRIVLEHRGHAPGSAGSGYPTMQQHRPGPHYDPRQGNTGGMPGGVPNSYQQQMLAMNSLLGAGGGLMQGSAPSQQPLNPSHSVASSHASARSAHPDDDDFTQELYRAASNHGASAAPQWLTPPMNATSPHFRDQQQSTSMGPPSSYGQHGQQFMQRTQSHGSIGSQEGDDEDEFSSSGSSSSESDSDMEEDESDEDGDRRRAAQQEQLRQASSSGPQRRARSSSIARQEGNKRHSWKMQNAKGGQVPHLPPEFQLPEMMGPPFPPPMSGGGGGGLPPDPFSSFPAPSRSPHPISTGHDNLSFIPDLFAGSDAPMAPPFQQPTSRGNSSQPYGPRSGAALLDTIASDSDNDAHYPHPPHPYRRTGGGNGGGSGSGGNHRSGGSGGGGASTPRSRGSSLSSGSGKGVPRASSRSRAYQAPSHPSGQYNNAQQQPLGPSYVSSSPSPRSAQLSPPASGHYIPRPPSGGGAGSIHSAASSGRSKSSSNASGASDVARRQARIEQERRSAGFGSRGPMPMPAIRHAQKQQHQYQQYHQQQQQQQQKMAPGAPPSSQALAMEDLMKGVRLG